MLSRQHLMNLNVPYPEIGSATGGYKLLNKGLIGLFCLVVMLMVSACSQPQVSERPPEPGDVAVARIKDNVIWSSDVRNEAVAQGLIGEGEPLDITSDLFRRMLEEVIDQKLLAREAVKKGLDRSVVAQRRLEAARERILGDMLVENTVDQAIDEKSVKSLYEEQLKLSKQSEEIRTRQIMLKTKAEAEAIARQLMAGSLFEAMAMERSTDQATRFNGGDMGYFTIDVVPQAYKAALINAKIGQMIGPFQTEDGWVILRIEDRRPEQPPTLEEARPQILRFLTYDQVRLLLNKLRDGAKVEFMIKESNFGIGADQEPASAPKDAFDDKASSASEASLAASSGTSFALSSSSSSSASSGASGAQTSGTKPVSIKPVVRKT
jgi:peptidyl-prolyl cis-trans isomerase C